MSGKANQGVSLNKLRRYKLILDLYRAHKTEDIPTTRVLKKYIYPVYPISRTTLYEILNFSQLESTIKKVEDAKQMSLF